MKNIIAILLLTVILAACSSLNRKNLGMERKVPDATTVSEQQPLILPPNYDLRPVMPINKSGTENSDQQ